MQNEKETARKSTLRLKRAVVKEKSGGTLLGSCMWSLLTFGASPEMNRDYYFNQIAPLLHDLILSPMPQSDCMPNPTVCQVLTLCWMHFTHMLENALYSCTSMLTLLLLTIYLNHMLHCLKYSPIFAHHFQLPVPSHSPTLAGLPAIYMCYINIQYGLMFLWFLNSGHGPALSFHREVNMKELEFLSPHCICFTFSSFHSLI